MIIYNDFNNIPLGGLSKSSGNSPTDDFIVLDSQELPKKIPFNQPYMNDWVIIGLCISGKCKLRINFKEYISEANTMTIIYPHSIIEIIETSEDLDMDTFLLSFDLISELQFINDYETISKINQHPCIKVEKETMSDLTEFYSFIVKQYNAVDNIYKKEMAKALLCSFNLKIRTIYKVNKANMDTKQLSRHDILADRFIKLLLIHYKEQRNISFYAEKLCLTPKHLSLIVKRILGKPMLFWINKILIMDAKFQLKTTDLSIKEISDNLNFPTPSLFGRFFKQHTGMTPVKYRES